MRAENGYGSGMQRLGKALRARTRVAIWSVCALTSVSTSLGEPRGQEVRAATNPDTSSPVSPATREAFEQLVQWVRQRGGVLSAHVVSVATRTPLLDHASNTPINPASNMKLLTAAAALDLLGPHHQFETGVYGTVRDDAIERLVLRGHGDPSLEEHGLWRLAHALKSRGVRRVDSLLVDQSFFDDQFVPPAFDQQPDEWSAFRAPISAIALARNTVTLNVIPRRANTEARVWFEPEGVVAVRGSVATRARGDGNRVQLRLETTDGQLTAHLGGHIAESLPRQRFSKRLEDPRLAPGHNLAALLRNLGVSVGRVALGGEGEKNRITYVTSRPLRDLLPELGKQSDNFYAEMLFKALAEADGVHPRSSAGGAAAVNAWLQALGPVPDGTQIVNGSGLFDANRLSASSLTAVLCAVYASPRLRHEYVAHLAIGGVDGTLRSRFPKRRERRSIRAKTGTLRSSIGLSGYVLRADAEQPLAFSFMVNGIEGQHAAIRAKIDAVVATLDD